MGKLPAGPVRWYSIQLIALAPLLLSPLTPPVSSPSLACLLFFLPPLSHPYLLCFNLTSNLSLFLNTSFSFPSLHLTISSPPRLSLPFTFSLMPHGHFYLTRSTSQSTSHPRLARPSLVTHILHRNTLRVLVLRRTTDLFSPLKLLPVSFILCSPVVYESTHRPIFSSLT